jgi:hypothetical protein
MRRYLMGAYPVLVFRTIVAVLPQVLLFLLVGAKLDLLGGWNRTDSGFNALILLFLVTPVATAILLVVETIRYRRHVKRERETRSFLMLGFALLNLA